MSRRASVGWLRRVDRSLPRTGDPHRNLMVAVVRAAIEDVQDAAAAEKALDYLTSTDRDWPFSFENLCDALDMSADDVRRRLTWWQPPPRSPASTTATADAERAPTAPNS